MKLVEFTYTKANGDVSTRALLELKTPQPNCEGIDVTDLEPEDFVELADKYQALINQHEAKILELLQSYDVSNNYRAFIPARMANVTHTWV